MIRNISLGTLSTNQSDESEIESEPLTQYKGINEAKIRLQRVQNMLSQYKIKQYADEISKNI